MDKIDSTQMDEMTVESLLQEMEKITEQLGEPSVSLEDSFALYQQGVTMLRVCKDKIDTIEKQMIVLNDGGEE